MPQPIIFQDQSGLAEGIKGFGKSIQDAFFKAAELKNKRSLSKEEFQNDLAKILFKEQVQQSGLNDILSQFGLGSQGQAGEINTQQSSPFSSSVSNILENFNVETPQGQFNEQIDQTVSPKNINTNQQIDPLSIPDELIVALQGNPKSKDYGNALRQYKDSKLKQFHENRKFESKRADKFFEELDEKRSIIPEKERALAAMENAFETQNLEFFSKDNFANFLGEYGEGLRTTSGATLLANQKDFLVSNIGRLGNRPNQWIEQQISDALTKIGRSKEANLSVIKGFQSSVARERKRLEIADQVDREYRETLGYTPGNIAAIVDERMKPYDKEIQDKYAYDLRKLYEQEQRRTNGDKKFLNLEKVPSGTPLTKDKFAAFYAKYNDVNKALENAKKLGYTIPTKDQYRRWERGEE